MKVGIVCPYGSASPESSLLHLLAAHVVGGSAAPRGHEAFQLLCNGVFSVCGRDVERDWNRGLHSCLSCSADQRVLADWAAIPTVEFSQFLCPQEAEASKAWVYSLAPEALLDATCDGIALGPIVRSTFAQRFGVSEPDLMNRLHEQFYRRLLLVARRCIAMAVEFLQEQSVDLLLVANGSDVLTAAIRSVADQQQAAVSLFRFEMLERVVLIEHPVSEDVMRCELILEDLPKLRRDARTWSPTLLTILDGLLEFLSIPRMLVSQPGSSASTGSTSTDRHSSVG